MTTLTPEKVRRYIAEGNKNEHFRKLSEEQKRQFVEHVLQADYLDLRCDWAFKRVLKDPALLIILLNDFLPERIKAIRTVDTEPERLNRDEKTVLMDIVAVAEDGREIVIEMQRFKKTDFKARMFYYGASMVRSQLKKGMAYGTMKPVYVISFMDFMLKHLTSQLVYRYQMMEIQSKEIYGPWLSIYLCELPRLQKESMSEMDYVEGWFHIFRESINFVGKPDGMDAHFETVIEAASIRKLPEEQKMDYFKAMVSDDERLEYGQDRYEEGKAEGKAEERAENVKALLRAGFEAGTIAKALGLTPEEIEKLA